MIALVGCGDSTDSENDAGTPASLAESIGCDDVSELDQMIAPIRGKGAASGLSCEIDGETIHIFARAPIEDPSAVGWGLGQPVWAMPVSPTWAVGSHRGRDGIGRRPSHCCILGSCVGSAYMGGQPRSIASGRSS